MTEWRYPLSDLDFGPAEQAAAARVLASGWLSMGPEVAEFEREFAAAIGVRHAIAVSSGTAALHLSLLVSVQPGDEVVQPALNFVASANMTRAVSAVPVFADITALDDPTISAANVAQSLTPHTRAVIVMHYGGTPCRVDALRRLCDERGISLIEDACHAVGARYGTAAPAVADDPAGSLADLACFSFFSNKNLATGEGGMVTTNHDDLAGRLRLLRSHGMTTLTWDRHRGHAASYDVVESGFNYRLDELHAAIGRSQLSTLGERTARRRIALARYQERLSSLDGWLVPYSRDDRPTAAHLSVVVAPTHEHREAAAAALRAAGIQTSVHYPSVTSFSAFATLPPADVPLSEDFGRRALSLPLHSRMSERDVDVICDVLCAHALRGGLPSG